MRFLYARTNYLLGLRSGGSVGHVVGVVRGLIRHGSVHILSNEELYGLEDLPCTAVKPIGRGWWGEFLFNFKCRPYLDRLIKDETPSLVYHRHSGASFSVARMCARRGIPLVLEFNGSWVSRPPSSTRFRSRMSTVLSNRIAAYVEPHNLARASLVVVVSQVLKEMLMERGVAPERILVNPNGVDTTKFTNTDGPTGADIRPQLTLPEKCTVVGFAGTFGWWHGIPELIQTVLRVNADPDLSRRVVFVFYGAGGDLYSQAVAELGNLANVRFAGVIEYSRIQDYLSVCDILLSPHGVPADGKKFFGSPTKLFEYMSMGKGIVASRLGQISQVLDHMETGLLCGPGNVDDIVEGIRYFADHPDEGHRMGGNARRLVEQHYTWDRNVERLLEAFRDVCPEAVSGQVQERTQ